MQSANAENTMASNGWQLGVGWLSSPMAIEKRNVESWRRNINGVMAKPENKLKSISRKYERNSSYIWRQRNMAKK